MIPGKLSDLQLTALVAEILEREGDIPDYVTSVDVCIRNIIPKIWRRGFYIDIVSASCPDWSWEVHIHQHPFADANTMVKTCDSNRVARAICELFVELCEKENIRLRIEKEEKL